MEISKRINLEETINNISKEKYENLSNSKQIEISEIISDLVCKIDTTTVFSPISSNAFLKIIYSIFTNTKNSKLENSCGKIYFFNIEGIKRNKEEREVMNAQGVNLFEDYILSMYASKTSEIGFKVETDLEFGKLWYQHAKDSYNESLDLNQNHSLYSSNVACDAAKNISLCLDKIQGAVHDNINWIKRWYDASITSYNLALKLGKNYDFNVGSAGDALKKLYSITKQRVYASKAIEYYEIFLNSPFPKKDLTLKLIQEKHDYLNSELIKR